MSKLTIRARVLPDGDTHVLKGRLAWAMQCLVRAGERGCTPLENPGPRWSGYVHRLRGHGFTIQTLHEHHGGDFAGTHARYVLKNAVAIEEPLV